jgi:glycosyltransferase involved in cell wall biosynthesis
MHVMFIHPNFPAQFGHIAHHLTTQLGWQSTFITSIDTTHLKLPFNHINYKVPEERRLTQTQCEILNLPLNDILTGHAGLHPGRQCNILRLPFQEMTYKVQDHPQPKTFYNPDTLNVLMDHMAAIYRGMRGVPQIKPDLVVGHMSYGTMLYLRNLYNCPFIGYYEVLPAPFWTDGLVLRKDFPPPEGVRLFNATYHTLTYLHLHNCDAGYTPTHFQYNTCPEELRYKLRVIFDGVDCDFFQRRELPRPFDFHGRRIEPGTRVVTYVSRGLESARGFDIFMKAAKKIYQAIPNVVFLIAGSERTNYGHEQAHIGNCTFKDWVLAQDNYDLSKFHFMGVIPTQDLPVMYSLSDLHIYLTVPYVLSWSMIQAMANACVILGSATAPVQEAIDDGVNGLLADFYDVDGLAEKAIRVLRDPAAHRPLGAAARQRCLERYEKTLCINQLVRYFKEFEKPKADSIFATMGS